MDYKDCRVLCNLKKSKTPLITKVPCDEFTNMVQNNFDYEFTGESKFYPYELPKELKGLKFQILAIVGASGGGQKHPLKRVC